MRNLFLVLAKLAGLFQIYRVCVVAIHTGLMIATTPQRDALPATLESHLLLGLVGVGLPFFMAWLLLTRTEWLANKLKIGKEGLSEELKDDVVLRTGTKLIGLYAAVTAFSARSLPAIPVKLVLGYLLAVKTDMVIGWITNKRVPAGQQIPEVSPEDADAPDKPPT